MAFLSSESGGFLLADCLLPSPLPRFPVATAAAFCDSVRATPRWVKGIETGRSVPVRKRKGERSSLARSLALSGILSDLRTGREVAEAESAETEGLIALEIAGHQQVRKCRREETRGVVPLMWHQRTALVLTLRSPE